ncbi:MAG TPA: CNNM domain-containing protein [Candidatus Saccharimonadales bacterium]|nr:CNNM domain-containing protein [Candidatus Saccharimonadales bacterium]
MTILISLIVVALLVLFSAICSGLNVALMSLDVDDLRRKAKLGNTYARRLLPLRANSHLTLASILLANVAVISATSLVLEQHFNGWAALIISTLLIVVFGEVLPQAFFARNALRYTGRLEPLLRIMILITYPISKPLQLLLTKLLGPEMQHLQSRSELGILIAEHSDQRGSELDSDEVEIMQGALQLSEKHVRDIMTEIGRVYWLTPDTIIDSSKIDEIKDISRSRIPVFDQHLTKCYGLLLMKDLIDWDFDEEPPRVEDLPLHPCQLIGYKMALDTLFRKFISSGTHLLPVEHDDKIVGIVTIEDLIEEIVGHEIEDETDRAKNR